jgi:thiol-disulfide isomerase/thioredoxin
MRKQILCLCVAILFLLSGCGNPTAEQQTSDSTRSTIATPSVTTTTAQTANTSTDALVTTITSTATSSNSNQSVTTIGSTASHTTFTSASHASITTQTVTTTQSTTAATSIVAPEEITFKATVRENSQNKTMAGITVTVYTNGNPTPAGSGVTDENGVARITLLKSNSYRVVLSNLPKGYEANAEYIFASQTVNITIRKAAVQNEADHSQAQYAVGKKMTNFTLMDTDGNTYKLYDLLEENQLVVLDFWFTTCEPCKSEFPYFEAVANTYSDKMKLLAINPINNANDITRFRKQLNANSKTAVTFPMMKDTCNLYLGFGVSTYPTTVFIDSSGTVRDIHIGAYDSEMAFLTAVKRYI